MNIKFKEVGPDAFVKIYLNEDGSESSKSGSFSSKPKEKTSGYGLNKEMIAWVAAGNTIEKQYTPGELAQKVIDDAKNALDSQKSTCIQLLNESEMAVSNDPPYPADTDKWKTIRAEWRIILKSDIIQTVPEKLFK